MCLVELVTDVSTFQSSQTMQVNQKRQEVNTRFITSLLITFCNVDTVGTDLIYPHLIWTLKKIGHSKKCLLRFC